MTTTDNHSEAKSAACHGQDKLLRYVILAVAVVGVIVAWVLVKRQAAPTFPPYWQDRLASAMAEGLCESRPVLILFHMDPLSETSQRLIKTVLAGEGREERFRKYRYVLVHVATSRWAPLAKVWKIQTLPTMVILDANGKEIRRHAGYIDAPEFWNEFIVPASPTTASRPASAPGS